MLMHEKTCVIPIVGGQRIHIQNLCSCVPFESKVESKNIFKHAGLNETPLIRAKHGLVL